MSPASSARSSSAAWRRSSIASGRVSANSAVSSSSVSALALAPAGDRAGHEVGADRAGLGAPRAAARDEAPVLRLDDVEHALRHPLGVDVARVDAQALGQRHAVLRQALADLVGRGERVLGRDVVAVGAQAAEVGGARGDELGPPVGEVGRHLDADVGHQPVRLGHEALHVLDPDRRRPLRQVAVRRVGQARAPEALGRLRGDLGGLLAVVAAVRDEVLQDDLLQVPVLGVHGGQGLERGHPVVLGLADARRGCRS